MLAALPEKALPPAEATAGGANRNEQNTGAVTSGSSPGKAQRSLSYLLTVRERRDAAFKLLAKRLFGRRRS